MCKKKKRAAPFILLHQKLDDKISELIARKAGSSVLLSLSTHKLHHQESQGHCESNLTDK